MFRIMVLALLSLFIISPSLAQDEVDFVEVAQLGGRGNILDVAWSPDGELVTVGSFDGVWIYDGDTLDDVVHLESVGESFRNFGSVAWSPDGRLIAGGNEISQLAGQFSESIIQIWDVETGELTTTFDTPEGSISKAVLWDSDGATLFAFVESRSDNALYFMRFDVGTGEIIFSESYELFELDNIRLADDGQKIIADNPSGVVNIINYEFDVETGELLAIEGEISTQIISPSGMYNAQATRSALIVSDVATGEALFTFETGSEQRFIRWTTPIWLTDTLLASYLDREYLLVVWDIATGERIFEVDYPLEQGINHIATSPDGEQIIVTRDPGYLQVIDLQSQQIIANRAHELRFINGVSWSPDGNTLIVTNNGQNRVSMWDVASQRMLRTLEGTESEDVLMVNAIQWSPDSTLIAGGRSVPNDATESDVIIWDANTGEILMTLPYLGVIADQIIDLEWSHDGRLLLGSVMSNQTGRGRVLIWDVEAGTTQFQREVERGFSGVEWSPDGNQLAFINQNDDFSSSSVEIWETGASSEIDIPQITHDLPYIVFHLAWRPNSSQLLIAGTEGQISLWDIDTDTQLISFDGEDEWFSWSPDGQFVASAIQPASSDSITGTINIWSVSDNGLDWQIVESLPSDYIFVSNFFPIAWSPDGNCVSAPMGYLFGGIRIWCGE